MSSRAVTLNGAPAARTRRDVARVINNASKRDAHYTEMIVAEALPAAPRRTATSSHGRRQPEEDRDIAARAPRVIGACRYRQRCRTSNADHDGNKHDVTPALPCRLPCYRLVLTGMELLGQSLLSREVRVCA